MLDFLILLGLTAIGSYVEDQSYSTAPAPASFPYESPTYPYEKSIPDEYAASLPDTRIPSSYPPQHILACYFDATEVTHRYPMVLDIERIPAEKCTQLIYSSAVIDERSLRLRSFNPEYDIQNGGYRKAVSLKRRNPDLKVLLAVGEFEDVAKERKYTEMIRSDSHRTQFVQDVMEYLARYNFDGLNIFWYSYESIREGDEGYLVKLVKELKRAFQKENYLLTITIPGDSEIIEQNYELEALDRFVDYMYIAAFDFDAVDGKLAYPHSAVHYIPYTGYPKIKEENVEYITKLVQSKIQLSSVVLGLPTFGVSYYLRNPANHQIYAPVDDRTQPSGPYTRTPGLLSYYEICRGVNNGTMNRDFSNVGKVPFAYRGRTWVGYDDEESLRYKVNYLQQRGYAGAMLFTLDLDDFQGVCGQPFPLLNVVQHSLERRFI